MHLFVCKLTFVKKLQTALSVGGKPGGVSITQVKVSEI